MQKLRSLFTPQGLPIFTSKKNVLIIQAYPRQGIIAVSYKGQIKKGKFDDNTIANMIKKVRFEKSANSFLSAVYKLIEQINH